YAALLKLDVPQVMACLDAELGATQKFAEPPPLAEPSHGALDYIMLQFSKVDWRKAAIGLGVLVALLVCLSALATWRRSNAAGPLNGLKPGVYQSTQDVSAETLPLPGSGPKR
ncbi:MAG TPA: hypothetical protein VMU04_03305, partial [Candidatus Acidoferrum sp.]|nr:hypothetical protein [Candidatus Acidoferrum sp.]